MQIRHIARGTGNENWHVEWKSKHRIFRLGFFKVFTAGWRGWEWRRNFNTLQRIGWMFTRFIWITREMKGDQYRLFCFAFGWRFRMEGRWK